MLHRRIHGLLIALAVLASASDARAQAAGVDITLSRPGQSWGVPCTTFTTVSYLPFVQGGATYTLTVYAAPSAPYILILGPPPTSPQSFPGIAGQLLVHAPLAVLAAGTVGASVVTACGEGTVALPLRFPPGPPGGFDFAIQAVSVSSVSGGLAFSRGLWITYL